MTTERERKEAYGAVADVITIDWPGIDLPGWPGPSAKRGMLLEVKRTRDAMRAASEVPLSPSGESELLDDVASAANGEMTSAEVDAVDRRYRELVASGRLDPVRLREAFERRFPPKAQPGPLAHTDEVRPVASRLEQEEAAPPRPPPEGQGPAAEEGPPPAASSDPRTDVTALSFCDVVMAWVLSGFPSTAVQAGEVQRYRDHLLECASCAENVRQRIAEVVASVDPPDGRP